MFRTFGATPTVVQMELKILGNGSSTTSQCLAGQLLLERQQREVECFGIGAEFDKSGG